jgi:type II secretory ATPase GspE/PulE/Tfp pilus assembly ATPase PilB-like protein
MCEECNFTGFKGRIVISEVLNIDSNIREQIYSDKNLNDIYIQAKDHGFRSIRDDAFEKIDWGVTTKGEIDSVLSQN